MSSAMGSVSEKQLEIVAMFCDEAERLNNVLDRDEICSALEYLRVDLDIELLTQAMWRVISSVRSQGGDTRILSYLEKKFSSYTSLSHAVRNKDVKAIGYFSAVMRSGRKVRIV